jgi:hypothetical protein
MRDRLCREHAPICIGTSATMASAGNEADHAKAVASVASRLFGQDIKADAVIGESLERATNPVLKPAMLGASLIASIDAELPDALDDDALRDHPLAVWIELEVGLADGAWSAVDPLESPKRQCAAHQQCHRQSLDYRGAQKAVHVLRGRGF